jgi:hypothetical protein
MPEERRQPSPVAQLAQLCGWRQRQVTACFDDVDGDDARRIGKGLDGLAALLDAGAPEWLLAAEFRRRGLGDAALALRMAVIRARRVSNA